jgi:ubiquinone/menaquinone biosynthesis C-methylase UbiE
MSRSRMSEHREFWSAVAESYDHTVDSQIGGRTRALVRERLAEEGSLGRVAELGCGTGFYTDVLASKADDVVATDFAPGMLEIARTRVRAANVTFQAEDAQRTSFPNGRFDTAFMSLLIHFTDPRQLLAEMRRILKPGGTLIAVNLDPRALGGLSRVQSVLRVLYRGATGYRRKPPRGFGNGVLTADELRAILDEQRFSIRTMETIHDRSRPSYIPVEYVRASSV